jgi:hypothetical protein
MSRSWWYGTLAALVTLRVAIALAALAGVDLPDAPHDGGHALSGDATGFYAGAREFIGTWRRVPLPLVLLLVLVTAAAAIATIRMWRRWPQIRPWLALGALWWVGIVLVVDVAWQRFSGAQTIGWPIVWAVPMLPAQALGRLDPNLAFWLGLPIQLACNAVTVVATAYAGLYATGRQRVGVGAAAAFALWPLLTGIVAGHSAWDNATWTVDVGLHSYSDPLSTALTGAALALLLSPRLTSLRLVAAGGALGYATAVRLSNAVLALAAAVLILWRLRGELRRFVLYAAGALAFAPLVLAYYPLGYAKLLDRSPDYWHPHTFSTAWLGRSWLDSLLWTPRTLAIVLPLALLGLVAVRSPWSRCVLAAWMLGPAIFYSFYWYTAIHPRFLWPSLPALFVLSAAGVSALARLRPIARAAPRPAPRRP